MNRRQVLKGLLAVPVAGVAGVAGIAAVATVWRAQDGVALRSISHPLVIHGHDQWGVPRKEILELTEESIETAFAQRVENGWRICWGTAT